MEQVIKKRSKPSYSPDINPHVVNWGHWETRKKEHSAKRSRIHRHVSYTSRLSYSTPRNNSSSFFSSSSSSPSSTSFFSSSSTPVPPIDKSRMRGYVSKFTSSNISDKVSRRNFTTSSVVSNSYLSSAPRYPHNTKVTVVIAFCLYYINPNSTTVATWQHNFLLKLKG